MRQQTYRTAYDEAHAELMDITAQFDALRIRKEQVERVVEALKPFLGLASEFTADLASVYAPSESAQPEHVEFTFTQVSTPSGESMQITSEVPAEPVAVGVEATEEQLAYFRQPASDPFQKRIDDALWGWQQRPEGLLSPI